MFCQCCGVKKVNRKLCFSFDNKGRKKMNLKVLFVKRIRRLKPEWREKEKNVSLKEQRSEKLEIVQSENGECS